MEKVIEFLKELAGKGIQLSLKGEQLTFDAPKRLLTKRIEARINELEPEIIRHLKKSQKMEQQNEIASSASIEMDYWRQELDIELPRYELLPNLHRLTESNSEYQLLSKKLSKDLSKRLVDYAKASAMQPSEVLLTVFRILLHKYTGQEDIVIGLATGKDCFGDLKAKGQKNRKEYGANETILPFRLPLDEKLNLDSFQQSVSAKLKDILTHSVPFSQIQALLKSQQSSSESVFPVGYSFSENKSSSDFVSLASVHRFELLLQVVENKKTFHFHLEYSDALYSKEVMGDFYKRFCALLKTISQQADRPLGEYSILPPQESKKVLESFNNTQANYPQGKCLHDLFVEQVKREPEKIAISFNQTELSYQQLFEKSTTLALYLQQQGVKPDDLIGLCVDRGPDMIVAMLGILQAGGAYVPLDPDYPDDRLSYILKDSQAKILLTQASLKERLSTFDGAQNRQLIELDQQWSDIEAEAARLTEQAIELKQTANENNLAYIIYTSGSTGQPKGVAIEHHSPVTLVQWGSEVYSQEELAGVLASTSICFDLSVYEIFLTLANGGKIILAPNALELPNLADKNSVTLINTVPSAMEELVRLNAIPDSVQTINLAGEPLLPTLVDKIYDNSQVSKVYDLYGPSEDTTYSTFILREKNAPQSIGRPIANTQVYLLDKHQNPQPIGVPGELHIAGDGLARGYLNQPALTDEKFIDNVFNPGTRLYKTGDLARWLDNGTLEYLGRIDTQVKIRGFRIEIGEIEAQLNSHPEIKESVVVAQGESGSKQLVGFYVVEDVNSTEGSHTITNEDLKVYLQQSLPEYMIPATFVVLDSIPLTQNGKINRRELENMEVLIETGTTYVAPSNGLETELVDIWSTVFNRDSNSIGIDDNFFELGGHSLLATRLISLIRSRFNVDVEQTVLFEQATIRQLANLITQSEQSQMSPLVAVDRSRVDPSQSLSFVQQRLWSVDQLNVDSAGYNVPIALTINTEVDSALLTQAFNLVIERHETLRTCFPSENGQVKQVILDKLDFELESIDLSHYKTDKTRQNKARQLCQTEVASSFDLASGPLFRAKLITLNKNEHILMLNMHHIISDDWSVGVMLKELFLAIDWLQRGEEINLPNLPIQYLDYSVWQRQWLAQGGKLDRQLNYWQEKLTGVPESLDMATDYPRPSMQSFDGSSQTFKLDQRVTEQLKQLAEKQNATLYMALLSAFKILLYRYTGQEDICVGSAIANRQNEETENLVGMFVNTLALRDQLDDQDTFETLLAKVKTTCLEAYQHQDTPFEKIVELVQPQRNIAINPLFQIMVILQNAPLELPNDKVQLFPLDREASKFDLTLEFTETAAGLNGLIEFNTQLYKPETIGRMSKHLVNLCQAIVQGNETKISDLDYLSEDEKSQLLYQLNQTQVDYPEEKCIHEFFVEQVASNPEKTAVVFEGPDSAATETLSYQELYQKSYDLALYLQAQGVTPDSLVGLCLERSPDMMIGILGITMAGGAYVPLDPDYPDDRLAYMVENSEATIVLTQEKLTNKLAKLVAEDTQLVLVDQQWQSIENHSAKLKKQSVVLKQQVEPDNLAYMIYTSGSTGQPKGVMVEHKALVNRVHWMQSRYCLTENDIVLQKTPYSFDVSVWEFFWPMMTGASVVFAKPGGHTDPHYLESLMNKMNVTTLHFVPSMLNTYLENAKHNCQSVRQVFCSGEALGKKAVENYREQFPNALLHNLYGPTEAAIDVTFFDCSQLNSALVPIGAPIDNIQIFILDKNNRPQPIGVPGELHIAGDGLARGYRNRPELTDEKFVPNPFYGNDFYTSRKMYKSGDLARWSDDGNIEYLGRIDTQVKIRGFRIETGEIEAQLNQHPQINDSVVIVQGQNENKQLVAFYQAKSTQTDVTDNSNTADNSAADNNATNNNTTNNNNLVELANEDLRTHLQQVLPEYMVPVAFVSLESIPLTPNGKVNRRVLEHMNVSLQSNQTYLAPRNEIEKQLVELWAEILNTEAETIGLNDNFFAVGGNSLNVITLATNIEKMMSCQFLPATLFKHNTIRDISQHLHDHVKQTNPRVFEEQAVEEQLVEEQTVEDQTAQAQNTIDTKVSKNSQVHSQQKEQVAQSDEFIEQAEQDYYQDSLAIVGISCHFPDAKDHRAFWENLAQGKESVQFISRDEAKRNNISADILDHPDYVPTKPWLEGKELFDPEFFKISSGNAALMDPQFRQLLMHSWKAVEDAGYLCEEIESTSVFMSASNHFYQTLATQIPVDAHVMENSDEFVSWLMGQGGTIPTMISYQLGLKGPSVFVHTNCSSSLTGLYSAYQSLQSKDVDQALVGAASLSATLGLGYIHQPGLNLSSDGHCKTFDADADGMVEGEGVSVILVKRAADAIKAGDNIYCLLRGISINNDGADKAGFYAPSVSGQSSVIQQVLDKTGINPESIDYVEAHGTGTALGDPIELMALSEAYQDYTDKKQFCGIGSVKPNIGHLDTAAGLVGCVKLALSLYHKKFPALINYSKPNPQIDFENSPFYVADKEQSWTNGRSPKRAALSSFGIGGTNTHAILEEYPVTSSADSQSNNPSATNAARKYLVPLSAKKETVLKDYAESLKVFLVNTKRKNIDLTRLAYTLQTGRKAMEHRVIFVVKELDELLAALSCFIENKRSPDYFTGNTLTHNQSDAILEGETLAEDEDFQELINHWVAKKKVNKLAKLWVNGTQLQWRDLYDQALPLRMSLPTYPFAKERHWIDFSDHASNARFSDANVVSSTAQLHPLLHSNTSDLSQQSYRSIFSGQEFFLADHVINGQKILPAVAYLEMARAAVMEAIPALQQPISIELNNVVWAQPIVVTEPRPTGIALSINENEQIDYEIYSGLDNEEVVHCQGQIVLTQQPQPAKLDIEQLQVRMQQGSVDVSSLYDAFTEMGTDFGPSHQGVSAIYQGQAELLARLSLPDSVEGTEATYQLHPSIMDGALQSCTVLIAGLNQLPSQTTLPFALESLRMVSSCTKEMLAWVRFSSGSKPTDKLVKVDIDICDLDGNICVQIHGYSSRVLTSELSSDAAKNRAFGTLYAEPVWQPSRASEFNSNNQLAGLNADITQQEIVLGDLTNVDDKQLNALLDDSQRLMLAQRNSSDDMAAHFTRVALNCFEQVQTIIKSKPQGKVLLQLIVANDLENSLITGLTGLLTTANLENPKFIGQIIFVEPDVTTDELANILAQNRSLLHDGLVKYEDGQRMVRRWQELANDWTDVSQLEQNESSNSETIAFKEDGVYLITGGLGGLGVIFSKEILRQTRQAKVIVTGRAELSSEKQSLLNAIAEELSDSDINDSRLEYQQLDLLDPKQINNVFKSIRKKYGQLNGIIHSAGMVADNFILRKTVDEFSQVMAPKVTGTLNLDLASQNIDLDFMVLFSSESSLGSLGQSDYACANGFMNQFAVNRNQSVTKGQRHGHTLAINWPLWKNGGMSVDQATEESLLQTTGMQAMQTETGLKAFYQCLALQQTQTLVIEGNLPLIRARLFDESIADESKVNKSSVEEKPLGENKALENSTRNEIKAQRLHDSAGSTVEVTTSATNTAVVDAGNLSEQTQDYLRKQFATLFKIPSHQIDPQAPLENYGIDSILAINLTNQLEKTFGSLSKTLLFEYQTVAELAEYFVESYSEKLAQMFSVTDAGAVAKSAEEAKPEISQKAIIQNKSELASSNDIKVGSLTKLISGGRFGSRQPAQSSENQQSSAGFIQNSKTQNSKAQNSQAEPIAIIGLSGRYPESENLEQFWHNLRDGKNCITEIPPERWDWRDYYSEDRTQEGVHLSKLGGFMKGVDEFDAKFFNISPREAEILDPQERIFLQHAWMAVEDAGYTRASLQIPHEQNLPGQVGVYVGVMYGEYQLIGAESSLLGKRMGFASSLADIANRVSYVLNLHGPSLTIDTMCSSSLTAIHLACQDLKQGRTDLAIAGGVNVNIHPNKYLILSSGQYISTTGACHSFGIGGDGYIPGEGVGAIILKRLSEAQRDSDHIYGVIKGSALSHGGKVNGYTVPNPQAQASAISQALIEANTDPRHVSYIEAHGTGTKLGDPIEIAALTKAFYQQTPATDASGAPLEKAFGYCLVGSAKSNIGHCEPAAGIAGLTKILLQMKHRQVFPSLHSKTLNPHIDFDSTPFVVNQTLTEWKQPLVDGINIPRIAGISSFGAGGANAHMIIEEYSQERVSAEQNVNVVIPLSARTSEQLNQKANELYHFVVNEKQNIDLANMAYTLQVGREAMEERLGFMVNSVDQLIENLKAFVEGQRNIEDFYQGQVKANKKEMMLIGQDDDMKEAINKWVVRKKLSKLLDLWVKGLALDWDQLYDENKPAKISLPTYPFAKKRFWIDIDTHQLPALSSVSGAQASQWLHPLLHTNTSDLNQQSYETHFNGTESFLVDNFLNQPADSVAENNQKLLPVAAYLEMARAAIEHASPVQQDSRILELHNIAWGQPAIVNANQAIAIALFAQDSENINFEIYSKDKNPGEENEGLQNQNDGLTASANLSASEVVHCQGYSLFSYQPAPEKLDVAQLKSQMVEANTTSTVEGVASVFLGDNQLLAQLPLATEKNHSGDYILEPEALNAALESSLYLASQYASASSLTTYLPALPNGLDSIRIIFACTQNMFAWIRNSAKSDLQSDMVKLDVDLCDEQGNVCVQIRGIAYQRISNRLDTVATSNASAVHIGTTAVPASELEVTSENIPNVSRSAQPTSTQPTFSQPKRIPITFNSKSELALSIGDPAQSVFSQTSEVEEDSLSVDPVDKPSGILLAKPESIEVSDKQEPSTQPTPVRLNEQALSASSGASLTLEKPTQIDLAAPEVPVIQHAEQVLPKGTVTLSNVTEANLVSVSDDVRDLSVPLVSLFDLGQGIHSIQISDAENGNTLLNEVIEQLLQALNRVKQISALKVLMIDGISQQFINGDRLCFNQAVSQKLYHAIVEFPYPVIAVMEGNSAGAGFLVGALCDFMVCSEEASYQYCEPLSLSGSEENLLRERFGDVIAHEFVNLSTGLTGKQLKQSGWVTPILPQAKVVEHGQKLATVLAEKPQHSLRLLKQHLARHMVELVNQLSPVDLSSAQQPSKLQSKKISAPKINSPVKQIQLSVHAETTLVIKVGAAGKRSNTNGLANHLTKILDQVNQSQYYQTVVLTSETDDFFTQATQKITDKAAQALQRAILVSSVPVIAALNCSAKGITWLVSQYCDACIYLADGQYSMAGISANSEQAKQAAMIFAYRVGHQLAKQILLTGAEFSGTELQQNLPGLLVSKQGEVLSTALRLAEKWNQQSLENLKVWKKQAVAYIEAKFEQQPQWFEVKSSKGKTLPDSPTTIQLASKVIAATVHPEGILEIKMEDREAKNMHSDAILDGLIEVFSHIETAPDYKVIVLTGYDNYFSTGGTKDDLVAIQEGKAKFTDVKVYHLAMECKLPVIAAMQGHGIGAGWALGMFADFVFFSRESKYLSPYMNFGFTPGAGATLILPKQLGYDLARESLLTAQEIAGGELAARGLSIPVLPRKEVVPAAMALAKTLANNAREQLIGLKHQFTQQLHKPLEQTYELELAMHDKTFVGRADTLEQIQNNFFDLAEARQSEARKAEQEKVALESPASESVSQNNQPAKLAQPSNEEQVNTPTSESLTSITATLKQLLADELHMELDEIDEDAQFVDLGLDSIYGVTWVRKVNEKYQVSIEAIKVYSYPTLAEFSEFVKEEADNNTVQKVASPVEETPLSQPAPAATVANTVANNVTAQVAQIESPRIEAAKTVSNVSPVAIANVESQASTSPTPQQSSQPEAGEQLSSITANLKQMLADELHMELDEIDEDAQFVDLGLDSIYGVTWVRKVNEKYQVSIEAIKVYSYPTLAEFSEYVKEEAEKNGAVITTASTQNIPAAQPDLAQPRNTQTQQAQTQLVQTQPQRQPQSQQTQAIPTKSSVDTLSSITATLKQLLADELHMELDEIDEEAQFVDLGLDSIYGVTWVRKVNEKYQVSIEAIKVYSYPTLAEFSQYVKEEAEQAGSLEQVISETATSLQSEVVSSSQPELQQPESSAGQPLTTGEIAQQTADVNTLNQVEVASQLIVNKLTSWRQLSNSKSSPSQIHSTQPIAVIGMAGQFPQANNLDEYWENISQGKNCITQIPQTRWDINTYYQEGEPVAGKTNSQWMGALPEYDMFDPLFFNISPIEAENMDPQQRIFLQACWHSIENAGYNAQTLSGSKCGVFVGCANGDYQQFSAEQQLSAQGFTGGATSILAARISYFLNLQGPCLSIETACSSSLVAIANACESLTSNSSDLALAGGVYVMAGPAMHIKAAQSGMLSPDGRCFTFDQQANGFVPGEGVGVVMLKRLDDAERDRDIIQSVIQGWGVNQDGKSNGITAPNPQSQTRLQQEVYDKYQIDPNNIQLIEAHGTGTKLGDPIEVEGLKKSFKKYTDKQHYCALGSVKSNIGHCVTAAGVAGVIKLILAIKHRQLPPTINFTKLNEHIGLENSPFYVNDQLRDWEVQNKERRQAAISSYGFSGTNVHMVVAEHAPSLKARASNGQDNQTISVITENSKVIVPLSAKTQEQLQQSASNLLNFLSKENFSNQTKPDLIALSYTLQVGREPMEERLGFMVDSIEQLVEKLDNYVQEQVQGGNKKIDGVYTGQVYQNKESMSIVSQDEDVKETIIDKWIGSQKLSKLLGLWVKGLEIDWNKLYPQDKPKRISLPVYPFAKERYWIESDDFIAVARKVETKTSNGTLKVLHPLLHENISDLSQQSYRTQFTGDELFLADHQVMSANAANENSASFQKVLPGVAYLEMVRAAVENAMPASHDNEALTLELHNTAWVQPVVVNETKEISIALFANESETSGEDGRVIEQIDYEVISREVTSSEANGEDEIKEMIHCQGQAVFSRQPAPAKLDLRQLKSEMLQSEVTPHELYAIFNQIGLDYGPAHQGIVTLYQGEKQVLAQLQLPREVASSEDDYHLHPSIMDSALQACIGLTDLGQLPDKPSIPFALESLRILSACTSDMFAWVRYSAGSRPEDKIVKYDIELCDQQGNICVQMRGFSARVIEPGTSLNSQDQTINDMENIAAFDDAFYEQVIESVLNNEISVDDAVEL
ncbi:non-ribosomal peptide synthetase [Aliikangiella coralliicola]|uniref:Amino acid adenylation domain-containing protein n=1 Tax=Aliikangiella coralliicola TaxID=2592383 RepID=A0A545U959_9GAMM|nr:non-ribosomal peptide synthetase [Aliikangiella coralliicola]TQV86004.1 amino acid adenylation domain-containing protein [Aliikangiella coralliicola]